MRRAIFAALLLASTSLTPLSAKAEPVSLFVLAVTTTVASGGGAFVAGLGAIGAGAFGAGLGVALGSAFVALAPALLSVGISFAASALLGGGPQQQATTPQSVQSNFSTDVLPRYLVMGEALVGGGIIFGEGRENQLTKLIAHCDSELVEHLGYFLDDTPAILDDAGIVQNDEYTNGNTKPFVVESRSGTDNQPAMQTMVDRWAEWTDDHVGAGVADTLLTVNSMDQESRAQLLRGRGNLRLGEPDVTRLGRWSRAYDPRDPNQDVKDQSTWGYCGGNPALMFAAHRMNVERFANRPEDIWWEMIAKQADICDQLVDSSFGTARPRYRCAVVINKNDETNIVSEDKILATCDGARVEDDLGRIGMRVGDYYEPTIVLTDEDIGDIETADSRDGEIDATRVFAVYTEPEFGYRQTTSAEFIDATRSENPRSRVQQVQLVDIPDHNQAMRVLKAATLRMSARRRLALTANHRAKRSREERFIRINSADNFLNGDWEVAGAEDIEGGADVALTLIETDPNRTVLLEGEETRRPNFNVAVEVDDSIENIPSDEMDIQPVQIAGSGAALEAIFTPPSDREPSRPDLIIQVEHRSAGSDLWNPFSVQSADGRAISQVVPDQATQECRWRTVTVAGRASEYSDIVAVPVVINSTPPTNLVEVSVEGGEGQVTFNLTFPADMNYPHSVKLYLNAGGDLNRGSDLALEISGAPNLVASPTTETSLSGTLQAFVEPFNSSNIAGSLVGPLQVTVT